MSDCPSVRGPYAPRTEAYERLVLDGGWLSTAQLAMECGQDERSVERTLLRQRLNGWVESRSILLHTRRFGRGQRNRTEWRAL
jgi:hypothetical protein